LDLGRCLGCILDADPTIVMRILFLFLMLLILGASHAQCPITVDAGPDIYLCAPPSPTQLDGDVDGIYFGLQWTPSQGLSSTTILNPTAIVTQTTNYVLSASSVDFNANLLSNSDFEGGNFGFSSDYLYNPGNLVPEGLYDVIDDPSADHPGFAPCNDHTSGSGNMMVVNGAGTPNQDVWCQTVPVVANTTYILSAWVTTVVAASPALLQFSINGTTIGPIFNAPSAVCSWQNFYQSWNSGSATSATICIVNQNTVLGGNDFALDDIVFAPVCKVTDTVSVKVINITAVASPPVGIIPCAGAPITLSGAGSSTGNNITYAWDSPTGNIVSGANTLSPVVNAAGAYTLTVTFEENGNTCEKTATVNVIENPNPLSAWINPPQPIGCGGPTITLLGNSNQPAFSTYAWSTTNGNITAGANQKNCTVNQAGTYTLVVTNSNTGCTATAEVTVTVANNPPTANATGGTINCTQPLLTLSGAGSSTGNNMSYQWTAFNGGTLNGATNGQNATASTAGSYVLAVTNTSNGCITRDTVLVNALLNAPSATIAVLGMLDCDTDTVGLLATANPATATLLWSGPAGGLTGDVDSSFAQALLSGAYTLTLTNLTNGCTATATAIVSSSFASPTAVTAPASLLTCQSPSSTLSGLGSSFGPDYTYLWTTSGTGNIVSGETTLMPLVNAAGTYTLTVKNTVNACTSTASVSVLADNNVLFAVANVPDTLDCTLNTLQLNADGSSTGANITYQWTTLDGMFFAGENTPNPMILSGGTYELMVSNAVTGCSATDVAVVVQDNAVPNLAINTNLPYSCDGAPVLVTAVNLSLPGDFTYIWTPGNGGTIISGGNTLTPLIGTSGNYTLLAQNLVNGCKSSFATPLTVQNGTPIAAAGVSGPISCAASAVTLSIAGSSVGSGIDYLWSPATGASNSVSQPGTYTLLVNDNNTGCSSTATVQVVTDTIPPPALAGPKDTLTCTTPDLVLVANAGGNKAGLAFTWSNLGGTLSQDDSLSVNLPGIYLLEVRNTTNGCISVDTVQIAQDKQAPSLTIAPADTLDCSSSTVNLKATGAGSMLAWTWQSPNGNFVAGQNSPGPTVDAAGIYTATLTSGSNGCSSSASVTVVIDTITPQMLVNAVQPITCADSTETITALPLQANANLTYLWTATNGGQILTMPTANSITTNTGGTYSLLVTNNTNTCTSTIVVNLVEDKQSPFVDAGLDDTLSCTVSQLALLGFASGAPALFFEWTASAGGSILMDGNTSAPTVGSTGLYQLLVTNPVNGCSASDTVQVFADITNPTADAGTPDTLTCLVKDLILKGSGSSGADFEYAWTATEGGNIVTGGSTQNPQIDRSGLYIFSVKNSTNGCESLDSVRVEIDTIAPVVNAGLDATLTCALTQIGLVAQVASTHPTLLQWSTSDGQIVSGDQSLTPEISEDGTYNLLVTDQTNGCTASDIAQVTLDTIAPSGSIAIPDTLDCIQGTVVLQGVVSNASLDIAAMWATSNGNILSGQNTLTPTVNKEGLYVLTLQNNQNGCERSFSVLVAENKNAPDAAATAAAKITCEDTDATLDGSGSSTGPQFQYQWTGAGVSSGANDLQAQANIPGTYLLTVRDLNNGCTATATATVGIDTTAPSVSIAPPADLSCIYKQLTINAFVPGSAGNIAVLWNTVGGNLLSGANTLTPVINQPGSYTVLVKTTSNGCTATAQVQINLDLVPPLADAGDTSFLHCNAQQVLLQGSSPTPASVFRWAYGGQVVANGPNFLTGDEGLYTLTVTHPTNGCTSTDSVWVRQLELPQFAATLLPPTCKTPTGSILFDSISQGRPPYQYAIEGQGGFSNNPLRAGILPGDYTLLVQDVNGCTSMLAVSMPAFDKPDLSLPPFYSIVFGDSVRLTPETTLTPAEIKAWAWRADTTLSCTACEQPWASPTRGRSYYLTLTDAEGCTVTAETQVRVDRKLNFYAPNIFSPDGDGKNDFFTLFGPRIVLIESMDIFDRWGNLIFHGEGMAPDNEAAGWDGRYKGDLMNPAVFVWQARLRFFEGSVEVFYGDVTLER
jgi:gliding motility-associated-like protein